MEYSDPEKFYERNVFGMDQPFESEGSKEKCEEIAHCPQSCPNRIN
jgi:hypothetical protein